MVRLPPHLDTHLLLIGAIGAKASSLSHIPENFCCASAQPSFAEALLCLLHAGMISWLWQRCWMRSDCVPAPMWPPTEARGAAG